MASSRCLRLLKFFLPISIIIFASAYLLTSSRYTSLPSPSWAKQQSQNPITIQDDPETKAAFIKEASVWEIDGPFNNTALQNLCLSKKWIQGLHFKCAPAFGGVGNVRNIVLTCVRYAIEAGATTILVPEITARGADLIHLETGNNLPFTYMFDLDIFKTSLTTACPQIRVVSEEADLEEFPSLADHTSPLTPKDLGNEFKVERVVDFPEVWREKFDTWLEQYGAPKGFSASNPLLVSLTPAFFEFPIMYDAPDFIATFGRIVEFNPEIRRLSAEVLYALDRKYTLGINASQTGIPEPKKYFGAHLRTDADAIVAKFANYDEQSKAYLKGAKAHGLSFIYLASGSTPDIKRFTADAKKKRISVTTKYALLEGEPEFANALEEMKKLSWDQQALIDFAILLRSSHFGGTWASSFAYNIVFKRHVVVNNGTWVHSELALAAKRDPKPEKQLEQRWFGIGDSEEKRKKLQKGECYKDSISTIYGTPTMGIWFELSMWP